MKNFIRDLLDQTWTLLGMFIAWLVLEGSAKSVTGWMIILVLVIWVITYPLRAKKDNNE